ncbi:MAG: hypothetical protein ACXVGQ_00375 [Mycobacteriaceae bacterium]
MSTMTLKAMLFGEDVSMGKAFKGAGKAAEETGGKLQGFGGMAKAALTAGAVVAVAGFAKSAVDAFKDVGGQVIGMQRIIGGTPEQVSRLRFAFQETGVDTETADKALGKFEKTIVTAGASSKGTTKMTQELGFAFKDAHGHILPVSDLMPKLADRFAKMKAGPEKTALAMQLFGKAGAALLPTLNKGSAGLADLAKESDRFGLTLTGSNVTALRDAKKNQREWGAAVEGVKVQFGAQLLPILTKFTTFLTSKAIPEITKITAYMHTHEGTVKKVATALGVLIFVMTAAKAITVAHGIATTIMTAKTIIATGAQKAMAVGQWLLNAAMSANPIGLVVLALVALAAGLIWAYKNVGWFRDACNTGFHAVAAVSTWLWNSVLAPVIRFILNGFANVAGAIGHVLQALGNIPGFGWAKTAGNMMVTAANAARTLANNIHNIPDKTVTVTVDFAAHNSMTGPAASAAQQAAFAGKHFARGGSNIPAGWKIVGEEGPELMWTPGGDTVIPARQTAAILSGRGGAGGSAAGGGDTFNVMVPPGTTRSQAMDLLAEFKRLKRGGVALGLA